MVNKKNIKRILITELLFAFTIFSSTSFALLCPKNFNRIDIGFTMDQVVNLCGSPDQQTQYQETITLSGGVGYGQQNGIFSQSQNYYSQTGYNNYQQLNDAKQKTVTHTKFIYNDNFQSSVLIFDDGILSDRQIIPH